MRTNQEVTEAADQGAAKKTMPVVPKDAVQTIGSQQFVFVPSEKPQFVLRAIRLGPESNGSYPRLEGVNVSDRILTGGSFLYVQSGALFPLRLGFRRTWVNGLGVRCPVQSSILCVCKLLKRNGAEGGSRTRTSLRTTDFKSVASAIPPPRHIWKK